MLQVLTFALYVVDASLLSEKNLFQLSFPLWFRWSGVCVPSHRNSIHISGDVELPLQSPGVHISQFAEYFSLFPCSIMFAEAPGYPGISVGISSVEKVLIVEIDHRRVSRFG